MSPLRQALVDYLAVRRALGYKLAKPAWLLPQFLTYLEGIGEERVTTKTALAWATLPKDADPYWWSSRLSIVRCFAAHLRARDFKTEVPPEDLLPRRLRRATPYFYSEEEIVSLMRAASTIRSAHRAATFRTLIGLLAITGMRIGEAIGLDRSDFDLRSGLLTIRNAKFGKSRELPLHASAVDALRRYLERRNRLRPAPSTSALFVSTTGKRLIYNNFHCAFYKLVRRLGLEPQSASSRPRLHDLRHSFAVRTLLEGYRQDGDPGARLALLSTYLGHVNPAATYWYLSATPELMELAVHRLERHVGGES